MSENRPKVVVPLKFNGFLVGSLEILPGGEFSGKVDMDIIVDELALGCVNGTIKAVDAAFEYLPSRRAPK